MKALAPLLLAVAVNSWSQNQVRTITKLDLNEFTPGTATKCWFHIGDNGLGQPILIPVVVVKGNTDGPVLGLQAAIHGNELNGIAVIQRVVKSVDPKLLRGTLVAVPGVNVPGLNIENRLFPDMEDLNRIMPGSANGNESQVYASRYLNEIASKVTYMIDLHTASFGRINSFYVRADMSDKQMADLAKVQNCDIILNSKEASTTGGGGTIRSALTEKGIPTITIELGDPQVFQAEMTGRGYQGIWNTLVHLGMIKEKAMVVRNDAVICRKSFWIYTDMGGLLEVLPSVNERVTKGQKIAILKNAFGDVVKEYLSPEGGIVIGKSTNPVTPTGGRILHLGILEK